MEELWLTVVDGAAANAFDAIEGRLCLKNREEPGERFGKGLHNGRHSRRREIKEGRPPRFRQRWAAPSHGHGRRCRQSGVKVGGAS